MFSRQILEVEKGGRGSGAGYDREINIRSLLPKNAAYKQQHSGGGEGGGGGAPPSKTTHTKSHRTNQQAKPNQSNTTNLNLNQPKTIDGGLITARVASTVRSGGGSSRVDVTSLRRGTDHLRCPRTCDSRSTLPPTIDGLSGPPPQHLRLSDDLSNNLVGNTEFVRSSRTEWRG